MESVNFYEVSEVELIYKPKVKASQRPKIGSSKDAAQLLRQLWDANKIDFVEQFKVLLLNRSNKVLGIVEIFTGGVTGTVVDCKLVFVAALKANACNLDITHHSLPLISEQSLPVFQSKVYHREPGMRKLFQSKVYQ